MDEVTIEGASITYRNFEGRETAYNREGARNFGVVLSDEQAEELRELGWNVRTKAPKEGYEELGMTNTISIKVNYTYKPPSIFLVTRKGTKKTELPERLLRMVDWQDFINVDLTFGPYRWKKNGKSGIAAYLRSFYGEIREDPLREKYRGVENVGDSSLALTAGPSNTRLALPPGVNEEEKDYVDYDYDGNREG